MRTKHLHFYVAVILMTAFGAHVAAAAENTLPRETTEPSVSPAISKRSTLRDPFWPVGFHPEPEASKETKAHESRIRESVLWPKLELRGISRTTRGSFIAIVDGIGIVESGDIVSMRRKGLIYRWRINKVSSKGISRTRLDAREPISTLHKTE
jgi:hypothetical protein